MTHSPVHEKVLTVRAVSGLSGDMLLTGLALMNQISAPELDELVAALGLSVTSGRAVVRIEPRTVHAVQGWGARVEVPHEHSHRTFSDIRIMLEKSGLAPEARALAVAAFARLAEVEAHVHGREPDDVCFHEVGAVDSILDIGLVCALYVRLGSPALICSPLPLCDGGVHCAHGWLPTPVPAVLELLEGVPVHGFSAWGETVTPTALTLLKSLDAEFGAWPSMVIERRALVYGTKIFEDVPNGVIWAYGDRQ